MCKHLTDLFSLMTTVANVLASRNAIVLWFVCSGVVQAAEPIESLERDTHFYVSPPSADDIGGYLFPDAVRERLTRSLSFKQTASAEKSVSMPVLFKFGKTTIVDQSRPFLDSVGQMLTKAQYADRTLIVEGHTDAIGSASYNQHLSELRALAVKEYLVKKFGIDPYRLFPTGRGESMLVQSATPFDETNRRVEFLPYLKD